MILSSDELEILSYLKSWNGNYVSMVEICRSAGGRKKFRETPHWARGLLSRLVDERLINVNERGHYCYVDQNQAAVSNDDENYFPAIEETSAIVGDNYFSPSETAAPKPERWISPHIENILKKAGKKIA